jgi:CarD family transcriptional regulator
VTAYRFIQANRGTYTVKEMTGLLGLSAGAYYRRAKYGQPTRQREADAMLPRLIRETAARHHRRYGSPRARVELRLKYGKRVSLKKVARLMREHNLNARVRRSFTRTTNSRHGLPVCENLLNRDFSARHSGQKWVSDITYPRSTAGFVYLTTVMDLCDRRIIGWALSAGLETGQTKLVQKNRKKTQHRAEAPPAASTDFSAPRGPAGALPAAGRRLRDFRLRGSGVPLVPRRDASNRNVTESPLPPKGWAQSVTTPPPLPPPSGAPVPRFPFRGVCVILPAMSKATKPFQVNQKVVYPSQGVGAITAIVEKDFKSEKTPYYVIYLEVSDMTIMVPIDKAEGLGIRPIVPKEEALRALELIGEEFEPIPSDWKMRYQMNLDLLKKGSVTDIAAIVRSLYHRSKVKELPILERKLYDSALKLLEDEVSYSLRKPKDEVENLIFARLESR